MTWPTHFPCYSLDFLERKVRPEIIVPVVESASGTNQEGANV